MDDSSSESNENSEPDSSTAADSLSQNVGPSTAVENPSSAETTPSVRESIGEGMHTFTDVINNNLVAARYAVASSVVLLSAYGLSNTPLFFRFRTVSEIPTAYFVNRKRLYGRIIGIDKSHEDKALKVYVRHLSPVGQILPKTWFDFFMKASPLASRLHQSRSAQKPEESKNDLLQVKIAGVEYPPLDSYWYKPEEFLDNLAKDRTLVSCQLLARQVPIEPTNHVPLKRKMGDAFPELKGSDEQTQPAVDTNKLHEQLAICKLSYRPSYLQLFSTDIAVSLILSGNAVASSSVAGSSESVPDREEKIDQIVESSQRVDDLRKDSKYLDSLTQAEYEALRLNKGIWEFEDARQTKADVVQEIEFQANANIFQKVWKRLRGE